MASKHARRKSSKKPHAEVKLQVGAGSRFTVARRTAVIGCLFFVVIVLTAAFLWPLPDEPDTGSDTNEAVDRSTRGSDQTTLSEQAAALEMAKQWVAEVNVPEAKPIEFDAIQLELRASIEAMVKNYPDDYKAHHLAGLIYSQLKQTALSESALRKCVELNGGDVQVRLDLAKELMQTGRDEEALQIMALAGGEADGLNADDGAQMGAVSLLQAELLSRLGKLEEASSVLTRRLAVATDSAVHWLELGKLQFQLGESQAASESIRKSIELDRGNDQAWLAYCQVLASLRATDELVAARKEFERLRAKEREKQPAFEEVHLQSLRRFAVSSYRSLALLYFEHRQSELAQQWFKRALELEPRNLPTLNALAAYYRRSKLMELACEVSRMILVAGPDDYVNYKNLASLCMESSDTVRAEAVLRLAAEREVAPEQSHLNLAKFLMVLNRPEQAVAAARLAVARDESAESCLVLSHALESTGSTADAAAFQAKSKMLEKNYRPQMESAR